MLTLILVIAGVVIIGGMVVCWILFDRKLRRDHLKRMEQYRPLKAWMNVKLARRWLGKYLAEQLHQGWPRLEHLRTYLLDASRLVDNPFSGAPEPILVFENGLTGPALSGRTIICWVKSGQIVLQTRDQNGVDSMAEYEWPFSVHWKM